MLAWYGLGTTCASAVCAGFPGVVQKKACARHSVQNQACARHSVQKKACANTSMQMPCADVDASFIEGGKGVPA